MPYPNVNYAAEVLPLELDGDVPRAHWQEWFSWAFVQAVASAAGLTAEVKLIDANQMDITVQTWHPLDGQIRTIGLQLKSKQNPEFVEQGEYVVHDLEGRRYNRLLERGNVPRFFVVVAVPPPPASLVQLTSDQATLGAAAWWVGVTGEPTDQQYRRIRVPTAQRFDTAGLTEMLRQA
ncbi:MAG: hypothetical protein JWO74_2284 [Solirubrobacterales bacterium]|nr:hypothetical protein [Solirubrobacterales bacterium]